MKRVSLTVELIGGSPPSQFRIFTAGGVSTTKGDFTFDGKAAQSVMAAVSDWGNDYCIDYGHSMLSFFSVDPAEAMKAAGWFTPMLKGGELWATNVKWTDKASAMLKAREARYISPAFNVDDDNRITELVNAALVNIPATKKQTPLVASRDREVPKEKKMAKKVGAALLGLLGLPSDTDEGTAMAALKSIQKRAREADELERTKTVIASKKDDPPADDEDDDEEEPTVKLTEGDASARLNALTGKASFGESLGVVLSWKASAERVEKLEAQIAAQEESGKASEAEMLVEKGVREGKIPPAQREYWLGIGKKDPATLKGFLATASTVIPTRVAKDPGKKAPIPLSKQFREAAAKLGLRTEKELEALAEKMAEAEADPTSRGRVELVTTKPAA